jgi:hypothetical protein
MRQFKVNNVTVNRMPISFDAINNCYGSAWDNCRSNLGGLPFYIRTGAQSGSDLQFTNIWARGKDGSVWVAPGAGGINFKFGQLTGGDSQGADKDDIGAVVLGKDYLVQTTIGSVDTVSFNNVDFEGMKNIHAIRAFGQSLLDVNTCKFLSTNLATTEEKPLSIIKVTNGNQSRINLINNTVSGVWKSAKAIDITGQGSVLHPFEANTSMINGAVTFNGVANPDKTPLLEQSKNTMGTAFYRGDSVNKMLIGGVLMRPNLANTRMEFSYDWGVTWFAVNQTAI